MNPKLRRSGIFRSYGAKGFFGTNELQIFRAYGAAAPLSNHPSHTWPFMRWLPGTDAFRETIFHFFPSMKRSYSKK
jgi:hypothetical protein